MIVDNILGAVRTLASATPPTGTNTVAPSFFTKPNGGVSIAGTKPDPSVSQAAPSAASQAAAAKQPSVTQGDSNAIVKWFVDNQGKTQLGEQSAFEQPDPTKRKLTTVGSLQEAGWGVPGQRGPDDSSLPYAGTQDEILKKQREDDAKRQLMDSRKSDPGEFKPMTLAEYNALDATTRASVDYNGMMQTAYEKDRALLNLDTDKSGDVSLEEAGAAGKSLSGYNAAYKRIFGYDPVTTGKNASTFAPNTLGVLSSLKLNDKGGDLKEYVNGSGFITEDDLKWNRQLSGGQDSVPVEYRGGRNAMVANLTDSMQRLSETLSKGRVMLDGVGVRASIDSNLTDDQRGSFVDSLRNGLADANANDQLKLSGEDPRFNPNAGLDLSALVNPETRARVSGMNGEYARITAPNSGVTLEQAVDPNWLKQMGLEQTGWNLDDWISFVKDKQSNTGSNSSKLDQVLNGGQG